MGQGSGAFAHVVADGQVSVVELPVVAGSVNPVKPTLITETDKVLVYRGNYYRQQITKPSEYPANMWLTYRTVRYRPASFKYRPT